MEEIETNMKELMDFAQDITRGLYYMKQTELCASFPIDGKTVVIDIKLKVEES